MDDSQPGALLGSRSTHEERGERRVRPAPRVQAVTQLVAYTQHLRGLGTEFPLSNASYPPPPPTDAAKW